MKKEPKALENWQIEDAQRLKSLFDAREPKISQAEFGAKFEIGSQGMVWQYVAARRPLNIKAATAFARGLGVNVEEISPTIAEEIAAAASHTGASVGAQGVPGASPVTDDEEMAPVMVRIRMVPEHLRAGITGFEADHTFEDGGHLHVPRQWLEENDLTPNALLAIKIKGDSMVPMMYEGDIAVVNVKDKNRVNGGVFALNYKGESVVKRLKYERREWYLTSENPEFHQEPCRTSDCNVVGRVVRFEPRNFKDRL
ncbi:S24 family peptidase [Janthinobacterium lividum]|uniref:S24 family peptidase n=1 Tax=Janthinobacterium aestuarii TaxID=2985511 RepID=A0ABZ2GJK7_9BURK